MNVIIRPGVPEDVPALLDLWVESWTAFLPEIDFVARRCWFSNYLGDLQREGAHLLVAADAGAGPLGFATVDPVKQDMDQLVTARTAQRRGIGRALVQTAKARSPAGLGLSVLQSNAPAIALYAQEGFVITTTGVSLKSGRPTFHMRWQPLPGGSAVKAAAAPDRSPAR